MIAEHRDIVVVDPEGVATGRQTKPGTFIDLERAEMAVRNLLMALVDDPDREGLADTPQRVAKMYRELFTGISADPAVHLKRVFHEQYDEVVLLRDIGLMAYVSVVSLALFVTNAQGGDGCATKAKATACTGSKDIVDTAVLAGSFNTLATALKAAGLVASLKGKGPFTVFTPMDEAFAKLPKGTVEGLLKDLPKLRSVLKYPVVPGKRMAADAA
ncbi:MAG: GTP cyclohydrolase I [Phycisphaerae bacterium]|nr:GTP cyclohydrolase I [Phycisphaerae bacterium]